MGLLLRVNKLQLAVNYFNTHSQKLFPVGVFKEVLRWTEMCYCDKHFGVSMVSFITGSNPKATQGIFKKYQLEAVITKVDAASDDICNDGARAVTFLLKSLVEGEFAAKLPTDDVQLPTSKRKLLSAIAARSVLPVCGDNGAVVSWCNFMLAGGGGAGLYVPAPLQFVLSPSELDDSTLENIEISDAERELCLNNIRGIFQDPVGLNDTVENGEAVAFVTKETHLVIDQLKTHIENQLTRNPQLFASLNKTAQTFLYNSG